MMKKKQAGKNAVRALKTSRRPFGPSYEHLVASSRRRPYIQSPGTEASAENFWNVPDLCAAYNWPVGLAGGSVIALVEFGGGWVQSDIDQYFAGLGLPAPTVVDFSVDGTTNFHGPDSHGYDGEVALGIQVAAASYSVATGKPASIRVYWSQDIAMAVRAATSDGCDVCSISWGYDEAEWKPPAIATDMEDAAKAATDAGMVIFAASGDNDSKDGGSAPANVDCPASCPHIVGCGGTTKTAGGETVWNNNPERPMGRARGEGSRQYFNRSHPGRLGRQTDRAEWFLIFQQMPIPIRATTSYFTARKRRAEERARSPRCMRVSSLPLA